MRKLSCILFTLLIVAMLVISGCSNEPATPAPATPAAPSTPTPAPAPPVETFKWSIQSNMPRVSSVYINAIEPFAKKVTAMSDGRLEITPYASGELVEDSGLFDAVSGGVVEMVSVSASWIGGTVPEAFFEAGLAMSWSSLEEALAILYEYGGADILREAYAEQGVAWIAPQPNIGTRFWATKPVNGVEDLKGLRVYNAGTQLFERFDAIPSYMDFAELFTSLSTGGLDAVQIGATAYWDLGFFELCPYYIEAPVLEPYMSNFLANMDAWNELPDDLKEIVTTAAKAVGLDCYVTQLENDYLTMLYKIRNEWNNTIIVWSDEEMDKLKVAADFYFQEHAKRGPRCAKQIEILKDYWALKNK